MAKSPGRGKEEDPKSRRARFLSFLRQETASAAAEETAPEEHPNGASPAEDAPAPPAAPEPEAAAPEPEAADERRKPSIWNQVDEGEESSQSRPAELFPLRGRRGEEPDAQAWEEAQTARATQQSAAREQAMASRAESELMVMESQVLQAMAEAAVEAADEAAGEAVSSEAEAEVLLEVEEALEGEAAWLEAEAMALEAEAAALEVEAARLEGEDAGAAPAAQTGAAPDAAAAPSRTAAAAPRPVEVVPVSPSPEPRPPSPSDVEVVPASPRTLVESLAEADTQPPEVVGERRPRESVTVMAQHGPPAAGKIPALRRQGVALESPPAVGGVSSENDVVISQVSISGEVAPRKEITFQMRYRNQARFPLRGITLRCDMPAHTSYMPESTIINGHPVPDERGTSPLASGRGLPLGDLEPRQEGYVAFTCILNPGLRDGTLIQHVAHLLQETRPVATLTTYTRARGEPIFADPDTCRLTASPEGVVAPGDVVDYTFAVRNVGTAPATGITLLAVPPQHARYVPNSTRWEGRLLADADGASPLFARAGLYLGTLAPGEAHGASFQMRVERPLDCGTKLECRGEVRSHEAEPVPIAPVVHEVASAPAFAEGRGADRAAAINRANVLRNGEEVRDTVPGELLTFTVTLANSGDAHAYHTVVWAQVPEHVEFVPGSVRRDSQNVPDRPEGGHALFSEEGLRLGLLEAAPLGEDTPATVVSFQGRVAWPLANGTELLLKAAVAAADQPRRELTPVRARVHAAPRFANTWTGLVVDPVGKVRPGEVLTFTIRYKNDGDAPASHVVLRAGLPAEAPYAAGSTRFEGRALPDEDGASVLFGESGRALGTVEAGASGEISFQATVMSPLDRGTQIRSRAALTCSELPPMAFPPVVLEVVSAPDFGAEKVNRLEVSPAEVVRPGEVLHYTLHFKNQGDANASGVVLRSRIPDHTTPVEKNTTLDGRLLDDVNGVPPLFAPEGLRLGDVPAGRSGRITYSAVVNRPLENATQIYHSVAISCDQARPVETKAVLVMVNSTPDFSSAERNRLDVFPKGEVSPGQKLTYTLDYRNSGDADATGVFIKARLPAHTGYVPDTTRVNGQIGADFRGSSPLFSPRGLTIGPVPVDLGGKVTFEVRVNTPLDNGTPLECQAQVGCSETSLAVATNKVENRVVSAPDFNQEDVNYLTASPSGETSPDEIITYHLRYKNTGNARATKVALRAEISEHVSYKPGTTLLNGRPVADVEHTSAVFTAAGLPIGTVDAETAGELSFQTLVHSPLDNGLTLSAQGFILCDPVGQISTNRVTHSVMSLPAFTDPEKTRVELAPSGPVRPGDRLTVTVHYANTGKAHAQGVSVHAFRPEHTRFVADSLRVNGQHEEAEQLFSERGKAVGRIDAGSGGSLAFQVDVERPLVNGTALSTWAVIRNDSTPPARTPTVSCTVSSHVDFSVAAGSSITPAGAGAAPGDVVVYTVRYANGGDANASGVALAVQLLHRELEYVPHMTTLNGVPVPEQGPVGLLLSGPGLPVGEVAAGSGGVATFTVRVGRKTADGARLGVRAEIRSEQGAPVALEAPALQVSAPPDFSDAAYNNLEVYAAGKVACDELLTYTINYGNRGNAVAPRVVLRAALPEHTEYVAGTTFLNGEPVPDGAGGSPLWSKKGLAVGAVEPQAYGNAVFRVKVKADLPNGTAVANAATIDCGESYAFTTNTTRNTVSSTPDFGGPEGAHLEVSPAGDVSPKATLTYLFNFRNRGNATATHVALRCRRPEHTRYLARSTKLNGLPVQDLAGASPLFTERGLVVPEVPPGGAGRVSFRVQVDSPLLSGTEVAAQMSLTGQQTPPVTSNRALSTVLSYPEIAAGEATFMQAFPPGPVAPGQAVTFVLYFQNTGSTHADALHVRSHLPPHTRYVPHSTRVDGLAVADTEGVSPLFVGEGVEVRRVEAGASGNVSFQALVEEATSDGSVVQARADLSTVPATAPASITGPALVVSHGAAIIPAVLPTEPAAPGMAPERTVVDGAPAAPAQPVGVAAAAETAAPAEPTMAPAERGAPPAPAVSAAEAAAPPAEAGAEMADAAPTEEERATAAPVMAADESGAELADAEAAGAEAAQHAVVASPEAGTSSPLPDRFERVIPKPPSPSRILEIARDEEPATPAPESGTSARREHLPLEKFVPPTPEAAEEERGSRLVLDIDRLRRFREERAARGEAEAPAAEEEIPEAVAADAGAIAENEIPEAVAAPVAEAAPPPEDEIPEAAPPPAVEAAEIEMLKADSESSQHPLPLWSTGEVAENESAVSGELPADFPALGTLVVRGPEEVPEAGAAPGEEMPEAGEAAPAEAAGAPAASELPLSVYLTITRDQVEALRALQSSEAGLLPHFEVSAQLMGRSFYGTYKSSDARALNTLMGSLSRSLSEYHRSHRTLLSRLSGKVQGREEPDLVQLADPGHEESLARVDDLLTRFYLLQEEQALSFSPPRHDSGKKSFIVGVHLPRVEFQLVRRLMEESKEYAGFLRHVIFVQTLMGTSTAARDDQPAEDLDGLLREYSAAMKSVLNRLLVNAHARKKIDLSKTHRGLERSLKALVDYLHQSLP